jgi:hypothetical protein
VDFREEDPEDIAHWVLAKAEELGGLPNGARMNANMGKTLFKELGRLGFDVEVDTRMKLVLNRPQHEDAEEAKNTTTNWT